MVRGSRINATTFATPSDQEFVTTRVINAPCPLVFDAWTDPQHLPNWRQGPEGWTMPVCTVDLRPGGGWHFVWRKTDGTEVGVRGVYREVVPPQRLVSTESWGGKWPETLNTVTLAKTTGGTAMKLAIHYPSRAARDAALGTGMKEGMSPMFDRLDEYLQSLG